MPKQSAGRPEAGEIPAAFRVPEIGAVLQAFRRGVTQALGPDLVALYVFGSVLTDDFEPATSDVDFLAVTREPAGATSVHRLSETHTRLAQDHPWGGRLEGGYAARGRLCPWGIEGDIAAIEPGGGLKAGVPSDYTADNMLAIRENGLALYGPPPDRVVPPVDQATFQAALREYLAELVRRSVRSATPADLSAWTLNIARCLYGLAEGRVATKKRAAAWLARLAPELELVLEAAVAVRRGGFTSEEESLLRKEFSGFARRAPGILDQP